MRQFETGATRDNDDTKLDYEGFFSPLVLERFAQYMNEHQHQSDGKLRASDNWQKGIPKDVYMKSGFRHFMDWWMQHRGLEAREDLENALCALLFNIQGYLYEVLKEKSANSSIRFFVTEVSNDIEKESLPETFEKNDEQLEYWGC